VSLYAGRLRAKEWEVRPITIDVARSLVESHHYARGASNTRIATHGLFRVGDHFDHQAQGVAWWLPPTKPAALASHPDDWQGVLSLSRLVVAPGVPKNACTFLLSRSMRLISRDRWPCLITYADSWRGHTGGIYRAAGWRFMGETKPERVYTLNGRMIARKAGARTRTHSEMIAMGCVLEGAFAKLKFMHTAARS